VILSIASEPRNWLGTGLGAGAVASRVVARRWNDRDVGGMMHSDNEREELEGDFYRACLVLLATVSLPVLQAHFRHR
jgi:hypothetical protein